MSVQFALMAAQMYLGIVFQRRPHKFTFQELLESNKGDETKAIPYIRGRWKTKPQRIWLGDFSARAVERDSVWTDYVFFGPILSALLDTITVGYRYYTGQGFALCWGPINRVHQVYVDDLPCAVAPVVDNAGGTIVLDDPQLFGGDQPPGLGGIYGLGDVIAGTYTQGRNTYLASVEGNVPALHGVAALIIRGRSGFTESGYFAANAINLREWQVELMSWPDVLGTGNAMLVDQSYNRIHAMYEWATNADFGAEIPASEFHLPSWRAAAQVVYDEGNGFSGEINTGGNVGDVFGQLRASVDAEVYPHPRDGIKIKLIRKDYSIPSIPILGQANTSNVEEYTPGDNIDTFNRVTLDYINAENNYQPRPAVYEDPANRVLQQRVSTKSLTYPGVASPTLAQQLVTRDGRVLAQPFPPLVLTAGEVGRQLWPGDVYKFEWTSPLIQKVFRVHARTPSVSYEGEKNFKLTATEDQYSIGMSVFGAPEGTDATNPGAIWDTAPPSASFDDVAIPPNGLEMHYTSGLGGEIGSFISAAIEFGDYAGGQYARVYVTPPGGVETLSPMRLAPDSNNKATFTWPALIPGTYTFCIQTYSLTGTTNGVKVCESLLASSPSVSPSASQSPSMSVSPSISPSSSTSPSASQSPSSSVSPSVSPSASMSPSISPSHSTSPSSSASPSGVAGPDSISDLEWWLKADAITGKSEGDNITTWVDSSGNSRDATTVAPNDPIYHASGAAPNSMPYVEWDGTNDAMSPPNFPGAFTAAKVFIVAIQTRGNPPASSNAGILTSWHPNNGGDTSRDFWPDTDGKIYDKFGSTVRKDGTTVTGVPSSWCIYEVLTKSGEWTSKLNGTTYFTTASNTVAWSDNFSPSIGINADLARFKGGIAEIIMYSRDLTGGEVQTVYDYLQDKYGIAIPSPSVSPSSSVSPSHSTSPSVSPSTSPSTSASPSLGDNFPSIASIWEWWEPSRNGFSDNDTITTLAGQANPGSRDFSQATALAKPTYKAGILSGQGIVRFSGLNDQSLQNVNPSALTAAHIFMVIKVVSEGTATGVWQFGTSGSTDHYCFTDNHIYDGACSNTRRDVGDPTPALTSWRVVEVVSTSSEWTYKLDGTQLFTTGTNTVALNTNCKLGTWGTLEKACDIAGVYLFSAKLSGTDRTSMVNYLNSRFGLSIS